MHVCETGSHAVPDGQVELFVHVFGLVVGVVRGAIEYLHSQLAPLYTGLDDASLVTVFSH